MPCPSYFSGGGGGNRTPVRKQFHGIFSGRRRLFQTALPSCSPPVRQTITPDGQVRVMIHGAVNSFRTHGRHINDAFPGLWPLRFRRLPLFRQRQQQCCCSLIYKLPILRMLGASARLSRFLIPVETSTPPDQRRVRFTALRIKKRRSTFSSPAHRTPRPGYPRGWI